MKTILFFVAIIAVAGFFAYRYFAEEDCVTSPVTGQCVSGDTTGYPAGPSGGGGNEPIEINIGG